MKKTRRLFYLLILSLFILPSVVSAANVAKVGESNFTTITDAVNAATSGQTIEILENVTANGLTLKTGVTLDVPANKIVTLTGNTVTQAGAIVKNNGIIIVENGVLDISKLTYNNNGLIPRQSGLIQIKSTGRVIMLDVWIGAWTPDADSSILYNCENGATINIGNKTFIYKNSVWEGAFKVTGTINASYGNLEEAITNAIKGDTITLFADAKLNKTKNSIIEDLTIDLNGFNISATNRLFEVKGATLNIIGKGTLKELVPDYAPIVIQGSNNVNDTKYTVVNIGKDVTLQGWSGLFVTPYTPSGNPYAYGVEINMNGIIDSVKDSANRDGYGIYINGQIQHKTNAPVINLSSTANIKSIGFGIYSAGYSVWNINGASIEGTAAGIGIKSGILNLNSGSVKSTGEYAMPTSGNGNGINPSGAAIQIESNAGYGKNIELNIKNGTFTSTNAVAFYEYIGSGTETQVLSIDISGGTFKSATGLNDFVVSNEFATNHKGFIRGGSYETNPSNYVKNGYKSVLNNELYTVSQVTVESGTKTLSGTITNGIGATVQLKQGGTVIKSIIAADGTYSLSGLASGIYNVVAIKTTDNGTETAMKLVEIKDSNLTVDLTIVANTSSNLVIVGTSTPDIIIEGLQENSKDVVLYIAENNVETNNTEQKKIMEANKDKTFEFFTFNLEIDGSTANSLTNVAKIVIPYDFTGKKDIVISRYHNNVVNKFTALTTMPVGNYEDATYYADEENGFIYLFTSKFSEYGIGYKTLSNPNTSDNLGSYIIIGMIATASLVTIIKHKRRYN